MFVVYINIQDGLRVWINPSSLALPTSVPSRQGDMRIEPSASLSPPSGLITRRPVTRSSCLGMEKTVLGRSKKMATAMQRNEG